jgi:uncharacterized membrane protein YagU involved in acid resistance
MPSSSLSQPARVIRQGALCGLGGALAMSVSTNLEMRVRGRGPSAAPANALERLFGWEVDNERGEQALVAAAHFTVSMSLGILAAAARRRLGREATGALLLASALLPELIVVPVLGAAEPPWQWSGEEAAVSFVHHTVYAVTTELLLERSRSRPRQT